MTQYFYNFRHFVESHFGVCLMLALVCGLFLPGADFIPKEAIPTMMAVIIFFAVSKIRRDDVASLKLGDAVLFYVMRFLVLPIVIYFAADIILPDYKYVLLLLLLLPTGATLPAVTAVMKGNPALSIGFLVLSSLCVPFVLPAIFGYFSATTLEIDQVSLFKTLAYIIFLPIIIYMAVFKWGRGAVAPIRENASFVSIFTICFVALTIVSSQRSVILQDVSVLLESVAVGMFSYGSLYIGGWFLYKNKPYRDRLSYALSSGNNNIVIGISLAFLYLPERDIITFVSWELAWLSALSLFQYIVSKTRAE